MQEKRKKVAEADKKGIRKDVNEELLQASVGFCVNLASVHFVDDVCNRDTRTTPDVLWYCVGCLRKESKSGEGDGRFRLHAKVREMCGMCLLINGQLR